MKNNIYKCDQDALKIANKLIRNGYTEISNSIKESEDQQELKLIVIKNKKTIWLVGNSVYENIDFECLTEPSEVTTNDDKTNYLVKAQSYFTKDEKKQARINHKNQN